MRVVGELSQKPTPLTTIKESTGWAFKLAQIGTAPADPSTGEFDVFLGFELKGDALVLSASSKVGVVISCSWSMSGRKPEDKIADLKRLAPKLLKAHPQFKDLYPDVKTVDLSKLKSLDPPPPDCRKGLAEFCKAK